jgi:hypothetical protein
MGNRVALIVRGLLFRALVLSCTIEIWCDNIPGETTLGQVIDCEKSASKCMRFSRMSSWQWPRLSDF